MTRRITLDWPDPRPFDTRGAETIRILAASDEHDPALDHAANREALGKIDLVVGCGDLDPEQVAFLADAFRARLVYIRGNHDHGGAWLTAGNVPVESAGLDATTLPGVALLGLGWPGIGEVNQRGLRVSRRREADAWGQVIGALKLALLRPPDRPWLVFSHVPPKGLGDAPGDPFHTGFAAYRLVLDRLAPRLWLHGHTTRASQRTRIVEHGATTIVNVTGSILIELRRATAT